MDKKRLREELGTVDFMTFKPLRTLTPGGCGLELRSYNLPVMSCRTVMMTAGFVTKGQMSELGNLNSTSAALCHLGQVTKTPLMPFLSAFIEPHILTAARRMGQATEDKLTAMFIWFPPTTSAKVKGTAIP